MAGLWVFVLGAALQAGEQRMPQTEFRSPLDLPLNLSGNFGQLRSTHFHAGLDIRTNQVIGHKVYAVADGYVARVRVNIYGYGKVVYINHPNGKTTVYAHLDNFSGNIAELVEADWAKNHSFEVDLTLKPWQVPVKSGDILGLSGNTGGSGGPHLHFEIRDTKTEDILNPLKNGYSIADTKKPVFTELKLYSLESAGSVNQHLDQAAIPITGSGSLYTAKMPEIPASGQIGVGVNAYDPLDLNSFRMGLYKLRFIVDDREVYAYTLDRLSVEEGRRISIHCDYNDRISSNNAIEKLWVLPGNDSRQYEHGPGSGVLKIEPGRLYRCRIEAEDANGNASRLEFAIRGTAAPAVQPVKKGTAKHFSFVASTADSLTEKTFKLKLPTDALFDDVDITAFEINGLLPGEWKAWQIGNDKIYLKKSAEITVDISSIPPALLRKIYAQNEGKRWVPSAVKGTSLVMQYARLGRFSVFVDTLRPALSPLDITSAGTLGKNYNNVLRFKANDAETGVASWEAWLNDNFLMLEYEYKEDLLFARRPPLKPGPNTLRIIVKDGVGNETEYKAVLNAAF